MKTGSKRFFISIITLAVLSLLGCYSTNKVSNQNIVDTYRNDAHSLHPEFTLLHVNDSVSQLYFKINESELLFERKTISDSFSAAVKIYCRINLNYDSPLIMDSVSTVLSLQSSANSKKEFVVGSIPIKINRGNKYLLTVNTYDVNSKRTETTYINADKMDFLGSQNFLIRNPGNGNIIFSPYFDTNTYVAIQGQRSLKKLYVRFYRNKFPIAAPPFSADDYESPHLAVDTSFTIQAHNGVFPLYISAKGMYHIVADSNDVAGITLYRFDDSYPNITQAYQMVMPLRYISSNDEFEKLIGSKTPKPEVDNFWITAASGNKDRARELIHGYYNRIQDANRYFTSYQEGWKTDRGMVYLIFGPPNSIYRSSEGETWTYGEERNYMALSFTFLRLDNPYSDNDYALQREANYRNLWYNAVDMWREGRVF